MAEGVLFNVAEKILIELGSFGVREIGLAWGAKEELKKLEDTMCTIKNVLLDAEEQQEKKAAVKGWLQRLKDVVYDADDLMDEAAIEALRRKVEIHGSMTREVSYFFTRSNPLRFQFGMGHRIKDIREKIDEIAKEMSDFKFLERSSEDRASGSLYREETYSYVRSSEVIGRDNDKKAIIELLEQSSNEGQSSNEERDIAVIPIVGIGGLGKTTLARFVFNDERVEAQFNPRIWVCASNVNRLKNVIEKIIKSATGIDCDNLDIEELQSRLRDVLSDRKFFLVLDDVWIEDLVLWTELRDLWMVGASGSRIIVTTRNKTVALKTGTNRQSYNLKGLPFADCLSLFLKWAGIFNGKNEAEHPDLVRIGEEIVRKCGGVPLAVRTLGGMLHSKTNVDDWTFVRDNEIWTLVQRDSDILPVLRLSYDKMPSHLKQCFAYCSLFPKHEQITKHQLILLWMAQGFLKSSHPHEELEDIGKQYFDELVARSFFQEVDEDFESETTTCTIHDLVYNLAQSVAGIECSRVTDLNTSGLEKTRHVTFDSALPLTFPESLGKVKKLRTFFFPVEKRSISKPFLQTLFSSFRYLRVLDFNYLNFEELPSSIGDLKHLRYLDLNRNYRLKKLPNSICKLLNLQTLILFGCTGLQELPRDFGNLINLRNFQLSSGLSRLPDEALGGLTSLHELLIAKSYELTSLSEGFQHLTALRKLCINQCPKLTSLPRQMQCLISLKQLSISRCPELMFVEEDLQGLRSLQTLRFEVLPKLVTLPKGLQDAAATLQILYINDCRGLETLLSSLGNFTSLKGVAFFQCPKFSSLPEGMHRLTALRLVIINDCPLLSKRYMEDTGVDWPKIAHVREKYIE